MSPVYDPVQGWIEEEEQEQMPTGLDSWGREAWARKQQAQQADEQRRLTNDVQPNMDRPFFTPGGFVQDAGKTVVNNGLRLVTDVVDVGLGLVDVGRAAVGNMEWGDVFDDSDNPLTQFRQGLPTAKFDTAAGQMLDMGIGIGANAASGKWLLKLPTVARRLSQINKVTKLSLPAYRSVKTAQKLDKVADTAAAGTALKRAGNLASKNSYLNQTYSQIAKNAEVADWWTRTARTATAYAKTKVSPRNVAETIAWDLWGTFNVMGEGDDEMDETIFDLAADLGVDVAAGLQTTSADTALWRKMKGMLDGTLIGTAGGALVDVWRIKRFAKNFKNASKADRKELLKAFDADAEELGAGAARLARGEKKFDLFGDPTSPVQQRLARSEGLASDLPMEDPWRTGPIQGPQLQNLANAVESERAAIRANNLLAGAETKGRLTAAAEDPNWTKYENPESGLARTGVEEVKVEGPDVNVPEPRRTPGAKNELLEGAPDPNLLPEEAANAVRPVVVDVPTVTPETLRGAVAEAIADGYPADVIRKWVGQALPATRVGRFQYIKDSALKFNEYGVLNVADSMWVNQITDQARREGWAYLDPESLELKWNRKVALDLDQGTIAAREAAGLDQAMAAKRFDDTLGGTDLPDPAVEAGATDAVTAELESAAVSQEEAARRAFAARGDVGEEQIVDQILNVDLYNYPKAQVQRLRVLVVGRCWTSTVR